MLGFSLRECCYFFITLSLQTFFELQLNCSISIQIPTHEDQHILDIKMLYFNYNGVHTHTYSHTERKALPIVLGPVRKQEINVKGLDKLRSGTQTSLKNNTRITIYPSHKSITNEKESDNIPAMEALMNITVTNHRNREFELVKSPYLLQIQFLNNLQFFSTERESRTFIRRSTLF